MKRYLIILALASIFQFSQNGASQTNVTPNTNLAKPPNLSAYKPLPSVPMLGSKLVEPEQLSPEAIKALEQSSLKLKQLIVNHPERMKRLEECINQANKREDIQRKLNEVRALVRDYVIKNDPQDMDVYQALTGVKMAQEYYNGKTAGIY